MTVVPMDSPMEVAAMAAVLIREAVVMVAVVEDVAAAVIDYINWKLSFWRPPPSNNLQSILGGSVGCFATSRSIDDEALPNPSQA
jgi:hypothetical protein